MKKIISLALAVLIIAAMSVTAFAAEIKQDTENKTGSTDITYTATESYVVIIPESMTVGTTATVEADNILIGYNKQLTVSVSSQNEWKLKNNDDGLGYTLHIGETGVTSTNNTVLTAASGDTVSKTLSVTIDPNQSPKYAGNYTDTLTFTVSVNDATSGS